MFSQVLDYWQPDATIEVHNISIWLYLQQRFGSHLDGRFESCSCGEKWVWIWRLININCTIANFWIFQTVRILIQGAKKAVFEMNSPHLEIFNWDLNGRNQACRYGEKWVFVSRFFKLKSCFWISALPELSCTEQNKWFFNRLLLYWFEAFNWHLNGWGKTCSYGETLFRKSTRFINNCTFRTIRNLMQGKTNNTSTKWFSTGWWFPIETLVEEIKPVVMERNSFWESNFHKTNVTIFSLHRFLTILREKRKQFFWKKYSCASTRLLIET